jgi:hypothetical protein
MGGVPASCIAHWDGSRWSALGSGMTPDPSALFPRVTALALYDDGGGADLYAGGPFAVAGGVTVSGIARWDGASWSAVGGGNHGSILALIVFDDGSGSALYTGAAGVPVRRWNGAGWTTLSLGLNGEVRAFAVFDDGSGPALYAGGAFTSASGVTLNHVSRWTGSGWAALQGGTATAIRALTVFDDGSGPALYAGGDGEGPVTPITRWDGASWSPVGVGFNGNVHVLATIDDGRGPALHAGGSFWTADGVSARSIARWDGATWSPLGAGLGPMAIPCFALAQSEDDGVPALVAGGAFLTSPARDSYLAKWSVVRKTRRSR